MSGGPACSTLSLQFVELALSIYEVSHFAKNDVLDAWREYDAAGRVTRQASAAANPDTSQYRLTVNSYNANGWLTALFGALHCLFFQRRPRIFSGRKPFFKRF